MRGDAVLASLLIAIVLGMAFWVYVSECWR